MENTATIPAQTSTKLKVLVADDNLPTRMLLSAAVKQWNYEVVEAKDGEEAWTLLQVDNAPRLLILDWLMPKLDGIDLAKRIRNDLPYQPYIILLTQMTGTENITKGIEAGANEFLSKPFNMAELRSRLAVGAKIVRYDLQLGKLEDGLKELHQTVKNINSLTEALQQSEGSDVLKEKINELGLSLEAMLGQAQDSSKPTL